MLLLCKCKFWTKKINSIPRQQGGYILSDLDTTHLSLVNADQFLPKIVNPKSARVPNHLKANGCAQTPVQALGALSSADMVLVGGVDV